MQLVIIYGPEASGKLTIARALAQQTHFRLFHNHISVDVAKTLFDFGDEASVNSSGMCAYWSLSMPPGPMCQA